MEIEKTLTLAAAPQRVWELLLDPQVMGGCVPGMKSIDVISPTEYVALMQVKISFISAKFKLRTNIVEQRAPDYLRAEGTGEDASVASSLKQQSEMFLTPLPDGGTELRIKVSVDVLGRLGTFGLSVMKTKADRMWEEFGANLRARIDGTVSAQQATVVTNLGDPATASKPAAAAVTARSAAPAASPSLAPVARPTVSAAAPLASHAPAGRTNGASWWSRLIGNGQASNGSGRYIHIEVRQGDKTIRVDWPLEGAEQCQAWLRDVALAQK